MAKIVEDPATPHVLPVRLDDSDVPELNPTTAYLDGRVLGPEEVAVATVQHLADYGRPLPTPPAELAKREEMARRASARADLVEQPDGLWLVKYRIHNGSEFPIHNVVPID
ncbi:MAG TPA: hypothetical protein VNE62_03760 [Actinomycetota bacterium]|nr:hypothetical protein [Actinomycetota bacterium]